MVRAPARHAGGRWFKSIIAHPFWSKSGLSGFTLFFTLQEKFIILPLSADNDGGVVCFNMSKKLSFIALFLIAGFSLYAQAGLKIFLEESDGKLTITGSQGKTRELIIPGTINDKPVTAIGEGAFTNKGLTLVKIPDSVTTIGEGAFSYNMLTTLVIGNSVETIGRKAFFNNKINDLTIGTGVKNIGMGAFADNELIRVAIPESVTTIEPYAFFNNKLSTISIPNGVTAIGEGAFSTNRIYSVVIGTRVEAIGDGAFYNNQLTSITVPSSLKELGKRVFESRITKRGSVPPVDYVDESGELLYTTANNFDTYYSFHGKKPGKYVFIRPEGWTLEE